MGQNIIVLFQDNSRVDVRTHIHSLDNIFKPVNDFIRGTSFKGATFEYDIFSCRIEVIFKYFSEELNFFSNSVSHQQK